MKYKTIVPQIKHLTFEVELPVYDLSVEDDSSYCVGEDKIIVHNCSTFPTTSFGSPMFSAALEAGKWAKVPVILDGGVKENGDIARAMIGFMDRQGDYTYGSLAQRVYSKGISVPMVMIGGQLAACIDAPGENIYYSVSTSEKVLTHKRFYGSASAENKQKTGQKMEHIEGKSVDIPCNGLTYKQKYEEIIGAIQSQISYAGGRDLTCFKDVKYMVVS